MKIPPSILNDKVALDFWNQNITTEVVESDICSFAMLCHLWSDAERLRLENKDNTGMKLYLMVVNQFNNLQKQFCLNPTSRRIHGKKNQQKLSTYKKFPG